MKWLIFRCISLITLLLCSIECYSAISNDTINDDNDRYFTRDTIIVRDTIYMAPVESDLYKYIYTHKSDYTNNKDRRVHKYRKFWGALIPTNFKLQYAGGMGLFSAGTGWDYGKRGQWETDLMLGYVPKYCTNTSKLVLTLKQNYFPWSVYLYDRFDLEPLSCGLYFTKIYGDDFWVNEPEGFPKNYYGFSTKIRANIYIGQRVCYRVPQYKKYFVKSVSFFYEISSCDLYIVTAFINSSMSMKDWLRLSVGLKFQIF